MSHQDRTTEIVVNHESVKQAVDELLPPKLFRKIETRDNSKWKPRMLAAAALFVVTGGQSTLTSAFELARKIVMKIFRWHDEPGKTYQGFAKQLRK